MRLLLTFLFIVTFGFGLISCGGGGSSSSDSNDTTPTLDTPSFRIDPELEPILNQFHIEANTRGINLDTSNLLLTFEDLENGVAGVCFTPSGIVQIDPIFRNRPELVELVYHELGHCLLGLEHRPNSIMQAIGFIGVNEETLDELFSEEFLFELPLFDNPPREDRRHVKYYVE